ITKIIFNSFIMNCLKEFFTLNRSINNKLSGVCKLCGNHYSDKSGSTGNFHKHLKRKHFIQYQSVKYPDIVLAEEKLIENEEELKDHVIKINRCILTELIVKCNLPPTIVERIGFRNFLKTVSPKWKPTSARYFTRTLLPKLLQDSQEKIKQTLDTVNNLSITVDVWTDRRGRSFIGVTGHFIDENYLPRAILLDFLRLRRSHTGENIRHVTEEILKKWRIEQKVFRIITDNAASMVKAYKFGLDGSDVAVNRLQYNKLQQDDDILAEYMDNTNFDCSADLQMVEWSDDEKVLDELAQNNSRRLSCFAHSLQLAVRDGLREAAYLSKSLWKCIQIAKKSDKSSKITNLLEDVGMTIKKSNMTRWSSEYLLMKSIINLDRKTIEEITDIIDDDELKFSNHDFHVLREAVDILGPYAEITVRVQTEKIATISLVVPSIVHLIDHLKNIRVRVSLLTKICERLEQSINERFAGIVKRFDQKDICSNDPFSDPIYFICAVLDPEFKFYWLRQLRLKVQVESEIKQSIIQMVLNECEKDRKHLGFSIDAKECSSSVTINHTSEFTSRKLFHYEDDDEGNSNDTKLTFQSALNPIHEISVYLNDPIRIGFSNTYWRHSNLSHLKYSVKRLFSVQASSAPIERVFSKSGFIMSPRRTAMSEEIFKSLVYLNANQSMI
ncbi:unnamed protein product, partial [Rotaria magnacalcarata]